MADKAKFHMTDDGPKPCHANVRDCKYGEHFDSLDVANRAFEVKNENKFGVVSTLHKDTNKDTRQLLEANAKYLNEQIKHMCSVERINDMVSNIARAQIQGRISKLSKDLDKAIMQQEDFYEDTEARGLYRYENAINIARIEDLSNELTTQQLYLSMIDRGYKKSVLSEGDKKLVGSIVNRSDVEWAEYYEATDKKHFSDMDASGSKFTDPNMHKVEDVLELAIKQRGSLNGDDRDKFITQGSSPDAFRDGNRYIMIKTPGRLGVQSLKEMKDDDILEVTRTKPGVPCNIVKPITADEGNNLTTDTAVAVISNDRETNKPILITTFPGIVTKNIDNPELDKLEGQKITVARARELLGDNAFANTRIVR